MYGRKASDLLLSGAKVMFLGSASFVTWNLFTGNERFFATTIMPISHKIFDGETAHDVAIVAAKIAPARLWGNTRSNVESVEERGLLKTTFLNFVLDNPIGLAAGFDKSAEAVSNLCSSSGFGFVEFGSVTPVPQSGNEKPRVFRLPADKAVINRYGFNSNGYDAFAKNLLSIEKKCRKNVLVGVNLGKNKNDLDYVKGYREGYRRFAKMADYIVINLSSPNTPGLRDLQKSDELDRILSALREERSELSVSDQHVPIFLKISPDLGSDDLKEMAHVIVKGKQIIDGLIISNTTTSRIGLKSTEDLQNETGGLSGAPLQKLSNSRISEMYKLTDGQIPIIGCGGVFTGEDAYAKIRAGASLVQIYTAIVYEGFPVVGKIKRELRHCLVRDGFTCVQDAIGVDQR